MTDKPVDPLSKTGEPSSSEVKGSMKNDAEIIQSLNKIIAERDEQLICLNKAIADADLALEEKSQKIAEILASHSWRFTAPLRSLGLQIRKFTIKNYPKTISNFARAVWLRLPMNFRFKDRFKDCLFRFFPRFFSRSTAYRMWQAQRQLDSASLSSMPTTEDIPTITTELQVLSLQNDKCSFDLQNSFVPLLNAPPLTSSSVRLIAFYSSKFYPNSENDCDKEEWTQVMRATPQFIGHQQPHLPGELGFYDLRLGDVQRRQVELAKLYGVSAFCFYFYWVAGKRLWERPLQQYLENRDLTLPFCLCWDNENESCKGNGAELQALDDIEFIKYLSQYLRDPRYLRVKGRPLLIVSRPSILQFAQDTAQRWREWCQKNGIGEIFLAYTQSVEAVDPYTYGFDAAIEFQPNNNRVAGARSPSMMRGQMIKDLINPDFSGAVYDWRVFLEGNRNYSKQEYLLFRGVCPSWDDEALYPGDGTVFYGSSPEAYQKWLQNTVRDTVERISDSSSRLVFVNAWNEWGKGAYLEPDRQYGYAYLEATRLALQRAFFQVERKRRNRKRSKPLQTVGVIVHAFYLDVFQELLEYFSAQQVRLKLYITSPYDVPGNLAAMLERMNHSWFWMKVDNRGRDILPFLTMMRKIAAEPLDIILKLHTKKSSHRSDGAVWRRDILQSIFLDQGVQRALDEFSKDPSLGMMAAQGHLALMNACWGLNTDRVMQLAKRLGMQSQAAKAYFPAGSMFYARREALDPLLSLALEDNHFEIEAGQKDGTLAHAIERVFGLSVLASGFSIKEREK